MGCLADISCQLAQQSRLEGLGVRGMKIRTRWVSGWHEMIERKGIDNAVENNKVKKEKIVAFKGI